MADSLFGYWIEGSPPDQLWQGNFSTAASVVSLLWIGNHDDERFHWEIALMSYIPNRYVEGRASSCPTNRWLWILVFASVWMVAIFTPWQHLPVMECPIKSILGIPCPTCGGIRATLALREFQILNAFTMNPLVTIGLFGAGIWGGLLLLVPHFPTPDNCQRLFRYVAIGSAVISVVYLSVVGV